MPSIAFLPTKNNTIFFNILQFYVGALIHALTISPRGPDKKPRTYRASSMNNLAQFNQRHEEFTKYLKDEKGIDVTENSSTVKAFLIFCVAMIVIFRGWWLYNHYKNGNDNNTESRYGCWKSS